MGTHTTEHPLPFSHMVAGPVPPTHFRNYARHTIAQWKVSEHFCKKPYASEAIRWKIITLADRMSA